VRVLNRTKIVFSISFTVASALAYSLTLPTTIAFDRTTERQNAAYADSFDVQLMEAKLALITLQEQLNQITFNNQSTEPIVAAVPFYSQFADISNPSWQKVGCGIASLAMLMDYYGSAVPPDTLLKEGIAAGAYIESAGWSHAGLIALASSYGLSGETITLYEKTSEAAYQALNAAVAEGPVLVSVHYTFEPTNPIPHLAVITDVSNTHVYYNDPAEVTGGGVITKEKFQSAWKKRYIEIRPTS